jgi:hypothetical protein
MNIKRFNKTNISQRSAFGNPAVYIHSSGNFCFNQAAAELMGITTPPPDFFVEIIQDEDSPKEWYVALSTAELGFKLRKEKNKDKYNFNSGIIAKEVLKTLEKTTAHTSPLTATLNISSEFKEMDGLKLFKIMTNGFKPKK